MGSMRWFWRGPAFQRAFGLMVHAQNWPEYDTLYSVAKGGLGTWIHPNSPADTTRPKNGKRDGNAVPLHVGGT